MREATVHNAHELRLQLAAAVATPPSEHDPVRIWLDPGLYELGADVLEIPARVTLAGHGPSFTVLTTTARNAIVLRGHTHRDCTLDGVAVFHRTNVGATINGSGTVSRALIDIRGTGSKQRFGAHVMAASLELDRVTVRAVGTRSAGVVVEDASRARITRSLIEGAGACIDGRGCFDLLKCMLAGKYGPALVTANVARRDCYDVNLAAL